MNWLRIFWLKFLKLLARTIMFFFGWKVAGEFNKNIQKAVMVAAPHTSNWDFLFMRCAFYILDIPMQYTIKKEFLKIPLLGPMMKAFGAIPIDRKPKGDKGKGRNMIRVMVNLMKEKDRLIIVITPEGTRKLAKKWKTGFYHIARLANVPLVLGYLDYSTKIAGVGPSFFISESIDTDLGKIKEFYKTKRAKYPHQFSV